MIGKVLLIFAALTVACTFAQFEKKMRSQMRDSDYSFEDSNLFNKFGMGSLANGVYLSPSEFEDLMGKLTSQFPEAFRRISIGKTYEGRDIPAYLLALY